MSDAAAECLLCGYEAEDEEDARKHLESEGNDPERVGTVFAFETTGTDRSDTSMEGSR